LELVLEEDYASEWASRCPTFEIAKKNRKNKICYQFQQTQHIVETWNITHFQFQRLGKLA
jgi:hypothetical protein